MPFPLDQCVLDCQRVDLPGEASQSGNMNVLLVAARRAQIEDHVQTVIDAGLSPWIVDVDAFVYGGVEAFRTLDGGASFDSLGLVVTRHPATPRDGFAPGLPPAALQAVLSAVGSVVEAGMPMPAAGVALLTG